MNNGFHEKTIVKETLVIENTNPDAGNMVGNMASDILEGIGLMMSEDLTEVLVDI
jgi:hypothetical protein